MMLTSTHMYDSEEVMPGIEFMENEGWAVRHMVSFKQELGAITTYTPIMFIVVFEAPAMTDEEAAAEFMRVEAVQDDEIQIEGLEGPHLDPAKGVEYDVHPAGPLAANDGAPRLKLVPVDDFQDDDEEGGN